MDTVKHTAGPWEWDCGLVPPDGPRRYADIYKDGGDLIIAHFNDLIPEGMANARLIAAAPEMLEALKLYVDIEERCLRNECIPTIELDQCLEAARAAISKAEPQKATTAAELTKLAELDAEIL